MSEVLQLPVVDLCSLDRFSNADSIRQACMEHGFFYLVNHGVEEELLNGVFEQSRKFFSLPFEDKMKLSKIKNRGFAAANTEKLDSSVNKGDYREGFYFGPLEDGLNQWPSDEDLPLWRTTMETYHKKALSTGTKLICLIAMALKLDEDFFQKLGATDDMSVFVGMLYYPGGLDSCGEEIYGASAHSDFGLITLLATDGVPGLQVCRDKSKQPQVWEDVPSLNGAFIVNVGDMMERWTNGLFRSTLHRVLPPKQDRFSVAFFINPNKDCVVECLESCCTESCPPRFPPIRCLDYLEERLKLVTGKNTTQLWFPAWKNLLNLNTASSAYLEDSIKTYIWL